jgi:hypothetical protein
MLTGGARTGEAERRAWLATISRAAEATFARCAPVPMTIRGRRAGSSPPSNSFAFPFWVTARTQRNCSTRLASHRQNPQRPRRKEPDVAAETDKPIDAVNAVLDWQRRWLQLDAADSRAARARLRRATSAFDALLLAETQVLIRAVHVTRDKRLPREADERLAILVDRI